jgi:tetratricopeptide (TPR) repeat protein
MRFIVGALALGLVAGQASAADFAHRRLGQGVSLVVAGDFVRAEPPLREALRADDSLAWGHYNLAVVLRATGRPEAAMAEYQAAFARFDPRDESALGQCLYGGALAAEALGDPARAAAAWSDFVHLARPYASEQPAVQIARAHIVQQRQLAGLKTHGINKASR